MQGSARRKAITRTGVATGSVWETRMRMDEVKGGIKVFNGEESRNDNANGDEDGPRVYRRLRRNQSDNIAAERRKRKNWQQPETNGSIERSPIQLRKARSELCNSPRISNGKCQVFGGEKIVLSGSGSVGVIGEKRVLLIGDGREDGGGDEVELEGERKSFDDKEIVLSAEKPKNVEGEEIINQIHDIPVQSNVEKKPQPKIYQQKKDPNPVKSPPVEVVEEMFESTSAAQNRMQNIVDLVMWRDISKSAFVFGLGTFILLSSSYTKDINFSLISAISYLGLVHLAVVFLYKSILRRGAVEFDERDERHMVGEEEAIWLLRLLLPYINELLVKLRALFSGDPATTMKLAVLLFLMARCGSSITIWKLAKLVFYGVFTIPKVCSSYKVQLARYGKFWLERFRDGWKSCTHKKAVAAAVFTLIWNLSSTLARVWAVFMLLVAVRLYQQRGTDGWSEEVEEEEEETVVVEEIKEDSTVMEVGREIKVKKGT